MPVLGAPIRQPLARWTLYGVTALLGCLGAATPWLRLNLSPSVPLGVYRLQAVPPTLDYGHLMLFPVPPSVQPWHPPWLPLLKPIAGLPGDTACIRSDGLTINGEDYGPVYAEAGGRPLPQIRTCVRIPPGFVFTASAHPKSLDSRYFGPVPVTALRAMATPLLTRERRRP